VGAVARRDLQAYRALFAGPAAAPGVHALRRAARARRAPASPGRRETRAATAHRSPPSPVLSSQEAEALDARHARARSRRPPGGRALLSSSV
jgi:hypothetical protein